MRIQALLCSALSIFALSTTASLAQAETIERIAAVAGDDLITLQDLRNEGKLRLAVKGKDIRDIDNSPKREEELYALTKELVQARLIQRQAKRLDIDVGEREVDLQLAGLYQRSGQSEEIYREMIAQEGLTWEEYRAYMRSEIEAQFVLRSEIGSQITPSDSDVRNCARELVPENEQSFKISQIFLPHFKNKQSLSTSLETKSFSPKLWWQGIDAANAALAQSLSQSSQKQPDNFIAFVKKYSSGHSAERDGFFGNFRANDLSRDFASVFTLPEGGISDRIESAVGYHIMKVDSIDVGNSEAFNKAQNQCRERIIMNETQRLVESWVNDLFEKNFVSIQIDNDLAKKQAKP